MPVGNVPLPNINLPPGYSWASEQLGGGLETQLVIRDPAGRSTSARFGGQLAADEIWDQYNHATGGGYAAPGTTLSLQQMGGMANVEQAQSLINDQELERLEGEYAGVPAALRTQYGSEAQAAGTWGNTPEFQRGLESEVNAGARGARSNLSARINALRRAQGLEDFVPGPDADPTQEFTFPTENNAGDNAEAPDIALGDPFSETRDPLAMDTVDDESNAVATAKGGPSDPVVDPKKKKLPASNKFSRAATKLEE